VKKRLLIVTIVAGVTLLIFGVLPLVVSKGLRIWINWKAHQNGLAADVGDIDAPLFSPVVIEYLRFSNERKCGYDVSLSTGRITVGLNFRAIILRDKVRSVRTLTIEGLRGTIRGTSSPPADGCNFDWAAIHNLLPDVLEVSNAKLEIEMDSTVARLTGITLTANENESGRFVARDITINAPWLRQTFSGLRGATAWQDDRLTIAAVSLARGVDLQSLTADLNHIGRRRMGLDLKLDTFGGKLRASVSGARTADGMTWDVAASASKVSLAQLGEVLGLTEHVGGTVRDCKFTFRGEPGKLMAATASIWAELTDFSWNRGKADTIMIGASTYNRQVQVEQIFVKQRDNQLTLSGEATVAADQSWRVPPEFQGFISGSIKDLGEFARLFGADASRFAGAITLEGAVKGRDRNVSGQLAVDGRDLEVFGIPADSVTGKLTLRGSQVEIQELELKRDDDRIALTGNANLRGDMAYSGHLVAEVADLDAYESLLPEWCHWSGGASLDWNISGVRSASSRQIEPPAITGELNLNDLGCDLGADSLRAVGIRGRVNFAGQTASAERVEMRVEDVPVSFDVAVDFADADHSTIRLSGMHPGFETTSLSEGACIAKISIAKLSVNTGPTLATNAALHEIGFVRDKSTGEWTCTIPEAQPAEGAGNEAPIHANGIPFCDASSTAGQTLRLQIVPEKSGTVVAQP
jgi:hypothetical protein